MTNRLLQQHSESILANVERAIGELNYMNGDPGVADLLKSHILEDLVMDKTIDIEQYTSQEIDDAILFIHTKISPYVRTSTTG